MARTTRLLLETLYDSVPYDVKSRLARDFQASQRFLRTVQDEWPDLYGQDEEEK